MFDIVSFDHLKQYYNIFDIYYQLMRFQILHVILLVQLLHQQKINQMYYKILHKHIIIGTRIDM